MTTQYETETEQDTTEDGTVVQVSVEARRALEAKVREWTGWGDAALVMGKPTVSPFAQCEHDIRTITANPETLVLNPNRVLLTLTPFRLRQEAVLTGALLHEAAHARHSHWKPRNAEENQTPMLHGDGKPVTKQTLAFARLMEEARIEGIMAREADDIGAAGLAWTMRAAAAHLVPTTTLSQFDDQQIMDLIQSWVLRAGRQVSLAAQPANGLLGKRYRAPNWVGDFTSLLTQAVQAHLVAKGAMGAGTLTSKVMRNITAMVSAGTGADTGTFMVDDARDVLEILFPETDGDSESAAMPGSVCQADEQDDPSEGEAAESEDEAESEEGEGEEGSQDDAGEDEGDEEGEGEDESDEEADDAGDGDDGSDSEDEPDSEGEGEGEPEQSDLAKALAEIEARASEQAEDETKAESKKQPTQPGGDGIGTGEGEGGLGQGWRNPSAEEREVQRGAERFLRGIIAPTEASKTLLTEAPSATVDGAALAAWKAGGQVRDPMFFRRVKRETQPMPPVQIAVLVDVSGSMDELQKPSALLSWALASAAFDLRNFAGRGVQVSSTLIHWGSKPPRVIQRNGEMMPGLKEFECDEGTHQMPWALEMVEEQMPGFFDTPTTPVNRLLVQFTDWQMAAKPVQPMVKKALEAGVNMLSIVPKDYSPRRSALDDVLKACPIRRGGSFVMKYNPMFPEQVWEESARLLG